MATARADDPPPRLTTQELADLVARAAGDPPRLLLLAAVAEDAEAERLRKEVGTLLPAWGKAADPGARQQLAQALPGAARAPAELQQILGLPARVARQILHRRYLEQWTYDAPVALAVTWEHVRGQPPRLVSVRVLTAEGK